MNYFLLRVFLYAWREREGASPLMVQSYLALSPFPQVTGTDLVPTVQLSDDVLGAVFLLGSHVNEL